MGIKKPSTATGWVAMLAVAALIVTNAGKVLTPILQTLGWVKEQTDDVAELKAHITAAQETIIDQELRLRIEEEKSRAVTEWNIRNAADNRKRIAERAAADSLLERVKSGEARVEEIDP